MVRVFHGVALCRIKLSRWRTRRTVSAPWPASAKSCWRRRECHTPPPFSPAGGSNRLLTLVPPPHPPPPLPFFSREYSTRFSSEDTLLFCMRVMVGVIILYDHVHPNGAFNKSSKIDVRVQQTQQTALILLWREQPVTFGLSVYSPPPQMKGCIKVLKDQPADKVEGLLNALK